MEFKQIETVVIQILQDAQGSFLFPYQIFNRIKQENTALGEQIENAYPTEADKPIMGEGAGIYFSVASFVAHALNKFRHSYPQIKKEWFDACIDAHKLPHLVKAFEPRGGIIAAHDPFDDGGDAAGFV